MTGSGTVFALTPAWGRSWNNAILYSFTGGADGDAPQNGVLASWDGRLFGTTSTGGSAPGAAGGGLVFVLTREGGW